MAHQYITIKYEIPQNLSEDEKKLFKKFEVSKIRIPKIRYIKNCFVTHQGLVLKNGFLIDGCAFNLKGKEDNTFYWTFWRDTIEKYAVCRWGKSLKAVHLKGPQKYLLIHSKWFNYAFWINSFLVRLIMAEKELGLSNLKLIVPECWQTIPYVWESLKAFNVELEIIPDGVHLFVDNLVMPETRQWTASFYPPHIKMTAERLIQEAKKRINNFENFPKKIYLSRAQRKVRCVENEDELIDLLKKKYNFEVVYFENLSIWEQIAMMNNATHFISIHGAGFSNVMFMKEGSIAIEFMEKDFAFYGNPFTHWRLTQSLNINYFLLIEKGKTTKDILFTPISRVKYEKRMELVNNNLFVNIEKLKNILDKTL